jgi:chromosome segregation ATPase
MSTPTKEELALAPVNLDNYLAKIDSCKKEIEELSAEITKLKADKANLKTGNADELQSLKEKVALDLSDAKSALAAAKIRKANADAMNVDLEAKLSSLNVSISKHEKEKSDFAEHRKNATQVLLNSQAEANSQKAENETTSVDLTNQQKLLSDKESELNLRAQTQIELQKNLNELAKQNQNGFNDIENQKTALDAQMEKIHSDIEVYGKQRDEDFIISKNLADKAESETIKNQAILTEIKERQERLQELIINQKIMAKDIDNRTAALRSQQDKVNEMTITLQGLKDELSKPQEAAK